jgi:4-oxalocrotonate tautomerase
LSRQEIAPAGRCASDIAYWRTTSKGSTMPFVNIRILKGHSKQRKDEISRRVTNAISEVALLPKEAVWVVFEDVESEDWYVGGDSVADIKARQT